MCPICWINGLIAFLIGMGILAIDSPYTPWLIGLAVVLTAYSMWKFHQGYKKWKGFSSEQRVKNWKTIKRFVQGTIVGAAVATLVFYSMYWEVITGQHHEIEHQHEREHPITGNRQHTHEPQSLL